MTKRLNLQTMLMIIVAIALALLVATDVAFAQAVEPTAEVPIEAVQPDRSEFVMNVYQLGGIILTAFFAGNVTLIAVARYFLNNKAAIDALERVALATIPVAALPKIRELVDGLGDVIELVDLATDGEENSARPAPPETKDLG